jgi:transposase-like protein
MPEGRKEKVMPVLKKDEEIIGCIIKWKNTKKVYCKLCQEEQVFINKPLSKLKDLLVFIKKKDLKKKTYTCDSCGGKLPDTSQTRFSNQMKDPKCREELRRFMSGK